MSEAYSEFAGVYDLFMEDVPYTQWRDFLLKELKERDINPVREMCDREILQAEKEGREATEEVLLSQEKGTILDLGCGTGTLSELLYDAGYDVIGVDLSPQMLGKAMEKKETSGRQILYLMQDMTELELYGTIGACVSVCDSINYLLTEEELVKTFSLVNNYLYPGGVFIFDFNTVYKYETVIGDSTIAENREEGSFIWENFYDPQTQINEYDLTLFIPAGDGLFRKSCETHYQRGYTLEQMKDFVTQAGLSFEKALDSDTMGEVTDTSERIVVIARESGK
ncbi:MAG: class I SAM-dependent methyltransferase [Lachnospiraceae bacterium]|nr:class I SAM-dependent methyltransferase [Lachnospiraceae bacterium]